MKRLIDSYWPRDNKSGLSKSIAESIVEKRVCKIIRVFPEAEY